MAHNVNLNSSEWCDLIFEGKNKNYGAYQMRQTSTRRHILALGSIVLLTLIISLIPQFIKAVSVDKDKTVWIDEGPSIISDISQPKEDEDIIEAATSTPPPPVVLTRSIIFTPPVIVDASEVNETNEMLANDEILKDKGIVSTQTVVTDVLDGVDIADLNKKNLNITGDGGSSTNNNVVDFAEVMPQYPGGQTEMMRFLSKNLKYPPVPAELGIEGRVILKFVVTKEGKIDNISILRSLDPACDQEAIRVVKMMPKWAPGMQNGNKVAVNYNLPVLFKLSK